MISENKIIELIKKAKEGTTLDYKEDLPLETDGDKAELVKDVTALANSGETAHIIIGVEDGTGKPVGFKTPHTAEQINQILKDKCDPSISVEYIEKKILGYKIGVIEIKGENPPYIVSVPDRYGGIQRGTIFVRKDNMNQGAKRADLDKMYSRANLGLTHEISEKSLNDFRELQIKITIINRGKQGAQSPFVWMQFTNVEQLVRCTGNWVDISSVNNNVPTIRWASTEPIWPGINMHTEGAIIKVKKELEQIETRVKVLAQNMARKEGQYIIALKKE